MGELSLPGVRALRYLRSLLCCGGLLLGGVCSLSAQADTSHVRLAGTVVDPAGQPIEGAEVRVPGTSFSTMTASDGTYRLVLPAAREILLQVRRPGYNPQLLRVTGNWSGLIRLTPGAFRLPDVNVTARDAKPAEYAATNKYDDVFRRRRIGLGELIPRAAIDQRAAQETTQLLEGRAGIRVRIQHSDMAGQFQGGTMVSFSRCNEFPPKINVYVDGHKLLPSLSDGAAGQGESALSFMNRDPSPAELEGRRIIRLSVGEMLGRVNPSDIEMMEIFRGPGELPAEFNDGNCGAIAIWTRQGAR